MSDTNEKGMVVGKRYMLTYKTEKITQITILKYSEFTDRDTDRYDVEYLLNTKTGELQRNFKYEARGNFSYFIDIIDMEKIDLEYSKLKLTFARASTSENPLLYNLIDDLIGCIGEKFNELYFETCLKIYNRLIGKLVRVTQGPFKKDTTTLLNEIKEILSENSELRESMYKKHDRKKGGGKKIKSKKRRRKSKKKKKSKTRRRRR